MPSDELIIDLSNYKDRVGQKVAPGRYRVTIQDAENDQSRQGNKMINIWFRITGGAFDGATIVDRVVITEKSLFRVVGLMQAVGLPTPNKRLKINIRQFVGKVIDIDVDDGEPYNGRVKSEVRGYLRPEFTPTSNGQHAEDLSGLDEFTPEEPETAALADAEPVAVEAAASPAPARQKTEEAGEAGEDLGDELEEIDLDDLDL